MKKDDLAETSVLSFIHSDVQLGPLDYGPWSTTVQLGCTTRTTRLLTLVHHGSSQHVAVPVPKVEGVKNPNIYRHVRKVCGGGVNPIPFIRSKK